MLSTPAAKQRLLRLPARLIPALLLPMLWQAAAAQADNCEPIRAQIEARMRAGGLLNVQLVVVDLASNLPGRVVGNCGQGTRKIVALAGAAPLAAAATPAATAPRPAATATVAAPIQATNAALKVAPNEATNATANAPPKPTTNPAPNPSADPAPAADDKMLTECKDGSFSIGPDCSRNKVLEPKTAGKS